MNSEEMIEAASKVRHGAFMHIREYTTNDGKIAHYCINFAVSYKSILRHSLGKLATLEVSSMAEAEAKAELLAELFASEQAEDNRQLDHWDYFVDADGEPVRGVRVHEGAVHVSGLLVWSQTIVAGGLKKPVNSSQKTLLKAALRRQLSVGKWVSFKLVPEKINFIRINGEMFDIREAQ